MAHPLSITVTHIQTQSTSIYGQICSNIIKYLDVRRWHPFDTVWALPEALVVFPDPMLQEKRGHNSHLQEPSEQQSWSHSICPAWLLWIRLGQIVQAGNQRLHPLCSLLAYVLPMRNFSQKDHVEMFAQNIPSLLSPTDHNAKVEENGSWTKHSPSWNLPGSKEETTHWGY